jgi:subtilisin family serine protease
MFEALEDRRVLAAFPAPVTSWEDAEFSIGEALFKTNANLTYIEQAQLNLFLNQHAATVIQNWDELDITYVRSANTFSRAATIDFAEALHNFSFVEYAEPNFISHINQVPNDPMFLSQWGLHNVGQNSPFPPFLGGVFDADIDAVEAWNTLTGDPQTVIAIIDTGIDYTHPDLAANIWRNPAEIADGFDNDGNGFVDDVVGWDTFDNDNDPMDFNGHGSHVSGIAGAETDNFLGVAGINWNTKLMAIKASNDAGTGLSSAGIVGAQAYITRMKTQFGVNIVVSNNSYGGPTFSFAQFDAIRLATNAGIGFVAAAGNNGFNTDTPANIQYPMGYNLPGIISVAATTRDDTLATFSNFGFFTVDLGAPGEEILSTWSQFAPPPGGQPPAPNVPPPGYGWLDGTSMASPMVAGAYGLIKAFDPSLSVAQVKNLLINTVDLLTPLINRSVSGGRLNLQRALDEIPRNEFHGKVFLDLDGDGRFDASETGQSGWTVYVDLNNNEVHDGNEPSTVSLADGTYNLRAKLLRGDYFIREVIQPGWIQTRPGAASDRAYRVTVSSNTQVFQGLDFGNKPIPGSVAGVKYNDLNGNGQRDAGEPGLAGFVIYVDINNDGLIGVGEPAAITDSQGRFLIHGVRPGVQIVREVQKPGFVQTQPDPAGPLAGGLSVLVVGGTTTSGLLFGNRSALDWGDAPASYGTLGVNNGARHGLLPNFFLGDATDTASVHLDDEANGLPTVGADGDDFDQDDDEDGVIFLTDVIPGQNATIQVSVSSGAYGSGYLHGWIDFNNDGNFDVGEQIIKNRSLVTGTHLITFAVPFNAVVSDTYARFRWGLQRDLGPTGLANGGEVEDYTTAARSVAPTAINDFTTVGRDSNFFDVGNDIDVTANDFPGVSGAPIEIFDFEVDTSKGGLVFRDDMGTPLDGTDDILRYKPAPGFLGQGVNADTFHYRIWDGTNISNTATVTIDVVPLDPVAVDDTFDIPINTTTDLDVLANDIEGVNGPLSILTVGTPSAGTAVIVGNKVRYTPPNGFQDSATFSYTIFDGVDISTAQVLVQVGGVSTNDIVEIEFKVFRSNGTEILANQTVLPGETIELRAFTLDLRPIFPDPDVPSITDARGVISAWVDALYDSDLVTPVPIPNVFGIDISFPFYNTLTSATASTPGIVDEAGGLHAIQPADPPILAGPHLLFNLKLTVNAGTTGGPLKFSPNPVEDIDKETLVSDDVPGFPSVIAVGANQIFFKSSPTIQVVGAGEGEGTNVDNPLDVNQDLIVSPADANLVITHLNRFGAGEFSPMLAAISGGVLENFLDVTVDGMVSARDAKLVIDYLNANVAASASSLQAEGEGDGDADTALLVSSTQSRSVSSSTSTPSIGSGDEIDYANNVDQLFVEEQFVAKPAPSVSDPDMEHDDQEEAEEDEFFAVLGSN